jgi:beta-N-acetylhexosaminidase
MPQPLVIIITLISNLFFGGKLPTFLSTESRPVIDPIIEQVSQMTLEEKIRQTLVCGYEGKDQDAVLKVLKSCSNIIYSISNLEGLTDKEIFDNNQQIHLQDPLSWIMVDQEGGKVARIKDGSPSPRKMAEENTVSYWGGQHGKLLKDLDFDVNLAPVADISKNNSAIGDRSFSDDPHFNGQMAVEYLRALQDQGIIGVVKHLPGHGRVDFDTHRESGYLNYGWDEISNFDLIPFIKTVEGGAKIVMVGHIIIPELDKKPASISHLVIEKLRFTLPSGNNLVFISDSLSMKGVGLPEDLAAIEALKAGEDMILLQGAKEDEIFSKILAFYLDGTLDVSQLDRSVSKILKVKVMFGKK